MAWIQGVQDYVLNFKEEIVAYCRSDLDILRRCCFANCFTTLPTSIRLQRSPSLRHAILCIAPSVIIPSLGYSPVVIEFGD